jgi:hypothetical protein
MGVLTHPPYRLLALRLCCSQPRPPPSASKASCRILRLVRGRSSHQAYLLSADHLCALMGTQ